ncbi:metallophosphoesterase [Haloplanus halobius]|uniref:metallophosphoesterase n=1 Tax=Haloplanus halobius TaxID=2934938 RepID=UPI00200BB911|nr:metallophosphoesterase [Haloplanus sp. XH21]
MLVICSDTHGTDGPRLTGRTRTAVDAADLVVHAGDFTTEAVLDAFRDRTERLVAVHGNADTPAVQERLPSAASTAYADAPIAVTHTERGGTTALSLFGRQRGAALVVFGHTHRPTVVDDAGPMLLNPGSYADPRRHRPAHAELWRAADDAPPDGVEAMDAETGLAGVLRTPDGDVLDRFHVPPSG